MCSLRTPRSRWICSCVDDVSIWWQMFNFVFLCPKRWFQLNSWIVRTHFSSVIVMTLNNWKMIAETRSYIFRWRSCFRRRRVCLSSLMSNSIRAEYVKFRSNESKNFNYNCSKRLSYLYQFELFYVPPMTNVREREDLNPALIIHIIDDAAQNQSCICEKIKVHKEPCRLLSSRIENKPPP